MGKIVINRVDGQELFVLDREGATIRQAVEEAIHQGVTLKGADLTGVYLEGAYLRGANLEDVNFEGVNLTGANFRGANLKNVNFRGANLTGANLENVHLTGAYLEGAYLRGANLRGTNLRCLKDTLIEYLPTDFVYLASRDMLFTFMHLRDELPYLKESLLSGKVDGTQYRGDCACLIGTIAKRKYYGDGLEKTCQAIPFYREGTHNLSETWFLAIHEGDTPDNNVFARHAVALIDRVLQGEMK